MRKPPCKVARWWVPALGSERFGAGQSVPVSPVQPFRQFKTVQAVQAVQLVRPRAEEMRAGALEIRIPS